MLKNAAMRKIKSYVPKKGQIQRKWYVVDAKDKVLGRLATRIAKVLQGKNKPTYTSFLLTGDYVIVTNAKEIKVTGRKLTQKIYDKYSGYPGGRKEMSLQRLLEKNPAEVIRLAVKGMLPKNTLAKQMLNSLKIYSGQEHPHAAQNPEKIEL
jgi:large subunit ribosomal protein L13